MIYNPTKSQRLKDNKNVINCKLNMIYLVENIVKKALLVTSKIMCDVRREKENEKNLLERASCNLDNFNFG